MLGNNLNDFIDDMYYNPEKEISYAGKRYMVAGYVDVESAMYTLTVYTVEKTVKYCLR